MLIGVTGSEGFIGRALTPALKKAGHEVRKLDIRLPEGDPGSGTILDRDTTQRLVEGCGGLIHLAAVSRVADGERDPKRCEEINVDGTANILAAATHLQSRPWILFASSREVYGEQVDTPVNEDAPLSAKNVYGQSKVRGEQLMLSARREGLATAILRFTNIYGPGLDHADRVVPAFVWAAATGGDMRVEGETNTVDFTHIDDVVKGVLATVEVLTVGDRVLPPIHLVSGRGISLGDLARLAAAASPTNPRIHVVEARSCDVSRFIGDPERARAMLGWAATIRIEDGVRAAVAEHVATAHQGPVVKKEAPP